MKGGQILQCCPPEELYMKPNSLDVAEFLGNGQFIEGDSDGKHAKTSLGSIPVNNDISGKVKVLLRPENIVLEENASGTFKITANKFLGGIREVTVTDGSIKLKVYTSSYQIYSPDTLFSLKVLHEVAVFQ
jgi:iron(III) transport system ATP-binding protein